MRGVSARFCIDCGAPVSKAANRCSPCWLATERPKRPVVERFWSWVDASGGLFACWPWTGFRYEGYGRFTLDYRAAHAHRLAWEWTRGPIPADLVIDHLCRNRACVNPAHMELVTRAENTRRGHYPNSDKEVCLRGHPFDEQNTYRHGRRRHCRTCRRELAQRLWAARAAG